MPLRAVSISAGYVVVMSESLCGRHPNKVDRQTSCPEQISYWNGSHNLSSSSINKGAGKRFARRAKRWAELQQRRQNARLHREHQDERFYHVIAMDLVSLGSDAIILDDSSISTSTGGRLSLPSTLSQSRQYEVPLHYPPYPDSQQPAYVTRDINEFGHSTLISIYHLPPPADSGSPPISSSLSSKSSKNSLSSLLSDDSPNKRVRHLSSPQHLSRTFYNTQIEQPSLSISLSGLYFFYTF